jgi:hypothetical protein
MERTKVNELPVEGKVRWKKVGGGSFRYSNKIIKPGQTFWAFPSEIPKSFRDVVIALDGNVVFEEEKAKEKKLEEQIKGKKPVYTIQPHGKSLFLVDILQQIGVDDKGEPITKVLNEKSLKKEVAEKMVEDLLK